MASLNQAKIIKALETIIKGSGEDFIWEFLKAYGTPAATIKRMRIGDTQRNLARIDGDLAIAQKLYFRAVKDGSSLFDALQEIKAFPLLEANRIRFILVTDFQNVFAYDRKVEDSTEFAFTDFPANFEFFLPMTGLYEKAIVYAEHPADTKACEKMGRLYDSIRTINHYEKHELHDLNVFLTRLLFCFFAEDTGIFPDSHLMTSALQSNTQADGSDVSAFFEQLFAILDLPMDSEERRQYPASFQRFPYVNGALFREKTRIPQFDAKTRRLLIDCGSMSWCEISPVIFGSMFQAVMDPEARRSLGAHYTSEKNILKLVRPLFLDALEEEFQKIQDMANKKDKLKALKDFQLKLKSLGFLDPACGCGNFLIVSYRELRELELRVLLAMKENAPQENLWMSVSMACKVNIGQFYGIEIEEFPVDVARVSMVLMEHVMNRKVGETFGDVIPSIPLKHAPTIVCANALTTPWEDVVAPENLNYILGNPPFVGRRYRTPEQQEGINKLYPHYKDVDYVACWFKKAAAFMANHRQCMTALVATNSIVQGEQVAAIWDYILNECSLKINFAATTFKWGNEARNAAAVYCVIIGFSANNFRNRLIIRPDGAIAVKNISPYLIDASDFFVEPVSLPLCDVPVLQNGNVPLDGDALKIEESEVENFVECGWIKRLMGGRELLHNEKRYVLWLDGVSKEDISKYPRVVERVELCRQNRIKMKDASSKKLALTPETFRDTNNPEYYIALPIVSSERRQYIPMDYLDGSTIPTNQLQTIPNATLYHFGVLTSAMHMAWMRTVCGRLEMRYRYSASIVYNTFPWPKVSEAKKKEIEALAEEVLMAREMYPDLTLADMYDPDKMPDELREAHRQLDLAVDNLYRPGKPFANDEERLQLLFKLYEELVAKKD